MNYSNPVRYFVSGNNEELFTFKPRKNPVLFYVQVRTKRYIPISIIVPAADLKDAKGLLRKAMQFKLECGRKYIKSVDYNRMHATSYREHEIGKIDQAQTIIDCIDGKNDRYEIIIEKIHLNQFFKTGWALNDTI